MKIKEGFVTRKIADTIVAVPTGELVNEFQGMIKLTDLAKFLWDLLQEDITIDNLANAFAQKYELDIKEAKTEVEKFVNKLKSIHVVEE